MGYIDNVLVPKYLCELLSIFVNIVPEKVICLFRCVIIILDMSGRAIFFF